MTKLVPAGACTPLYQIAVDRLFGAVSDIQINVALTVPSCVSPTVDAKGNLHFSVPAVALNVNRAGATIPTAAS